MPILQPSSYYNERHKKKQAQNSPKIPMQKQNLQKILHHTTADAKTQNILPNQNPKLNLKHKHGLQPETNKKLHEQKSLKINIKLLV